MYLSKMKVFGFKSFCEKLEVNFDQGITAIVGPNGCGKTNIIDAVRWVFGEHKNSILRSERMEDLIFSGTAKRAPLGMAEVSLVVQNDRGALPVEYSEVMITRRVYRSGESEYRLNKVPCRLKDITTLFMDTGMGTSSYSIIEGKMIDSILSDKTDERRFLFEEAAGISKYKRQRIESLRQLDRTGQDLARINDKVEEAGRNVRILQRHVSKARRYKEYYAQLKELELSYENHRYQHLRKKIDELTRRLQEIDNRNAQLLAQRDTERTRIEEKNLLVLEKEKELQTVQDLGNELSHQTMKADRDLSVALERKVGLGKALERLIQEQEVLNGRMSEAEQLRMNIEKSHVEHQSQLEEAEAALNGERTRLREFDDRLAEHRSSIDQLGQRHIEIIEAISQKGRRSTEIAAQIQHGNDRLREVQHEMSALDQRLHELGEEANSAKVKLEEVNEESANLSDSRERLVEKMEAEDARYRSLVEEEKQWEAQQIAGKKQLDFLESLNVAYEGYAAGTKAIMEARDRLPGVRGILADKIRIKTPYVRAIESFLGQKAQTIVTDSIRDVTQAIRFLEEDNRGRATLLALDRLAEKSFAELPEEILQEPGVLSRGTDCVEMEPSLMPLVHHLLDYVIVVENREVADALARKWSSRRLWFVTVRGECHASNGFVTGGRTGKTEIGLISRKQTIEKLGHDIEQLGERIHEKKREREGCLATRNEARMALLEADERLNAGNRTLHEHEANLRHLDERIMGMHDRRAHLEQEITGINRNMEDWQEASERVQAEQERLEVERQALERQKEDSGRYLEEKGQQRAEAADGVRLKELEVSGLHNRMEQQRRDAARLAGDLDRMEEEKLNKQREHGSGQDELQELLEQIAQQQVEIRELSERKSRQDGDWNVVLEAYHAVLGEVENMRSNEKGFSSELEQLRESLHAGELEKTQEEGRCRRIRERVYDAYEIDLDSPPEDMPNREWDPETVEQEIARFKELIKRIGQVNMAALEDYEAENARFTELAAQRDDLQEAKESLEKAVRKLDRSAREQFLETFSIVQKNFREVFVSLFEGGEATVSLEPGIDPLEARIDINARPTGKKMRGVQLLSGGERALTAISLLFALYLTKPSPYCVLDEVDAPLDDANIGRFVGLLKRFSARTQFIVVTHNKVTMEASDRLYGVTMEERGVSRLVSVQFEEAEAMAA